MPGQTEGTVKQKTAARKERELKLAFNDLLYQDALLHVSDSDSSMDYGTDSEFGTESDYSDSNDDDDDGDDDKVREERKEREDGEDDAEGENTEDVGGG